jgi:hypothetical protein
MAKEKKPLPEESAKGELVRRFKANPGIFIGTIVVLVIVIIAFVFVPAIVPSAQRGGADLKFGTYGKTPISYVPGGYLASVRENMAGNAQKSGQDVNNPFMNYQIWRAAFEQTVVHTAILEEMKKAGYTAPTAIVDYEVASLPQFRENGRFSAVRYRQMDNTSRTALWREVQEQIAEERYRGDVGDLRISSKETPFIKAMASPQRSFDMAAFSLSNYPDTEITTFASSHPELFKVTHLSKITVKSSEKEAAQVLKTVQDGTSTFEDAAKTHSIDTMTAEKGGDMGVKMAFELQSEIPEAKDRDAAVALAKGAFSAVIKTDGGWTFFRAEEDARAADTTDAANLAKIKAYIMDFERGRVEDFFLNRANTFIASAQTQDFDSAVAEEELTKKHFGPSPINYGNQQLLPPLDNSVPELSGAALNENFWTIAFSTPLNTPSKPFVAGNNVLVLYPVEEVPVAEDMAGYIESAYSQYWLSYIMEQTIRSYFIENGKLKDNFMEVYIKYLQPSPNQDQGSE